MVASLWHQLLGTKVRLLVRLPEWSWAAPRYFLLRVTSYYLSVVPTYITLRVDLYRSVPRLANYRFVLSSLQI